MTIKTFLCAAVLLGAGAGLAQAEDMDPGQATFMQYCAGCHGNAGKGDGPMADQLTTKVADLTQLTKNNDGVFPMLDVIHIIDGRTGVRGHGGEMPIWGDRYKAATGEEAGPYGAELLVRGRILAVAQYLESIQK